MLHPIDLARIDLNLLVLFETVMRERHVGRAAERMRLSPSAVSHGLSRLRAMLGDPLFIKTPRGVTPTERALTLDTPISEILARVRGVVATSAPFEPRTSTRSFTIGAPDGVSAIFLPPLGERLQRAAPGINIRVKQLLPRAGETSPETAWRDVFDELDGRAMDVAVIPTTAAPARFATRRFYEDDFVIAARSGHMFLKAPDLAAFCTARHLVVSSTGDPHGFVDTALAGKTRTRRVALTVPNFMMALAQLAGADLIAAVPRRFLALHGKRFGLGYAEAPLTLPRFTLTMVMPKPALQDAGLAWFIEQLVQIGDAPRRARRAAN